MRSTPRFRSRSLRHDLDRLDQWSSKPAVIPVAIMRSTV
jgi:hypothetical protein